MAHDIPTRRSWVNLDTGALEDNFRLLRSLAPEGAECVAVVKADAYGHGLGICAPAAARAGAQWLGVTSVEEGVAARAACPEARILIMCGAFPGQAAAVIAHRLTPVVWESWQIADLQAAARAAGLGARALAVHLEIDTGMSRQGVRSGDLKPVLAQIATSSPLRVEAVMTHLYASDEADLLRTAKQMKELEQALSVIAPALQPEWLSVGASSALLGGTAAKIAALAARWNLRPMLRLGLALYGVAPRFEPAFARGDEPASLRRGWAELRPVLSWKSHVVSVREIPAGAEVGYNGTFVATEPMRVALVAAGYADGLDRRLSNRFSLLIRGQRAPLVGRVSMDHCVVDVTEIEGVRPGDEVVLLGRQDGETISAYDHADATGTIPWEVFTRIGSRVARIAE
ncbi:MAG: alanine racemase [Acidobacteriota bacterium]